LSKAGHIQSCEPDRFTRLSDKKGRNDCLKGIEFGDAAMVVHKLYPQMTLLENVVFVDPKKQLAVIKENDPSHTIRQGKPVDEAVENAFGSGLLTLSEIAFDKTHQYAVMSFSFV
jgi:hypothetical protein